MNSMSKSLLVFNRFSSTVSQSNKLFPCTVIAGRRMASSVQPNLTNLDKRQVDLLREQVIVVDENDKALSGMSKKECHLMANINDGLLHRAFSVLLFNTKGEFLVTQRSDEKIIFPNRITNACCSHPLFNQLEMEEKDAIGIRRAAQRRLQIELGIDPLQAPLDQLKYIRKFYYKAASDDVWGEHEIDYVLILQKDVELNPDSNEVKNWYYVARNDFLQFVENQESKNNLLSPWFKKMVDNFLFDWWDNLKNLNKFQDHKSIVRL